MVLFVLMGFAAMVIDLGFTRLAQRQMQTAVDNAALEGLRWRDAPPTSIPAGSARQQASSDVANVFDDDMNPADGDPMNFGAGPVLQFQGGNPVVPSAAQQIVVPATPVYKPTRADGTPGLELNVENETYGDLVAGTYGLNSSFQGTGGTATTSPDENDDYTRRDFSNSGSTAFLARMRRTANVNGLDHVADVSTGGPTIPYLWGRGTMLQSSPSGLLQGITVRATAIAAAGNVHGLSQQDYTVGQVKTAGPSYAIPLSGNNGSIPGLAPFALRSDAWIFLTKGGTISIDPSTQDPRVLVLKPIQDPYNTSHYVVSLTAIGQPADSESSFDNSALSQGVGNAVYLPIFSNLPSQASTVVGFVYYDQWSYKGSTLTLSPVAASTHLANQNASGAVGVPIPQAISMADVTSLFQLHANLASSSLYAPVLVNHYNGPNNP